MSLEKIMEEALNSQHGVALRLDSPKEVNRIRRRFYACREALRRQGVHGFDVLSFQCKPNAEIWIIRRDKLRPTYEIPKYQLRPLKGEELPRKLLSRGLSRIGIA